MLLKIYIKTSLTLLEGRRGEERRTNRNNTHWKSNGALKNFYAFGHTAKTSSFTKYDFLHVKNNFAKIVDGLSVLKMFKLSNGNFFS